MLNKGETPEQAAMREVREELGIEVRELKLAYSDIIPPHDGFLDSKSFCYQVEVLDKTAFLQSITLDTKGHEAAEFVSNQEAQRRLHPIEAAAYRSFLKAPAGLTPEFINGESPTH